MTISLVSAGTAFVLGALHALEPGHGKTFIAAFMIGNKGTLRHVLTLGLSLAFSHTLVLIVLAVLMKYSLSGYSNHEIEEIIGILSPLTLLMLGGYLLWKNKFSKNKTDGCVHDHDHSHDHHQHEHGGKGEKISHRLAAIAGFAGGLLPCPSAVAAFIFSGNSGNFNESILFIVIYVIGLVAVLVAIALGVKMLKDRLSGKFEGNLLSKNAEFISSLLIIGVGLFYLIKNIAHDHI